MLRIGVLDTTPKNEEAELSVSTVANCANEVAVTVNLIIWSGRVTPDSLVPKNVPPTALTALLKPLNVMPSRRSKLLSHRSAPSMPNSPLGEDTVYAYPPAVRGIELGRSPAARLSKVSVPAPIVAPMNAPWVVYVTNVACDQPAKQRSPRPKSMW